MPPADADGCLEGRGADGRVRTEGTNTRRLSTKARETDPRAAVRRRAPPKGWMGQRKEVDGDYLPKEC